MAKKIFGLASAKFGPVASDGGMGTALQTLGETVAGTASITSEDPQTTDFSIEESSSPVESIVTQEGKISYAWSSYRLGYYLLKKFFGGTGNYKQSVGSVNALGALTGGSGYTDGFYEDVALTVNTGAGTGARANLTVAGGAVTNVEMTALGSGYSNTNTLSAPTSVIGAGTSFSQAITSVHAAAKAEMWNAPDTFPDIEGSLELTDKNGNVVKMPRVKVSGKMSVSFSKDKLGQIDFTATILQPTKANEPRMTMQFVS